MRGKEKQFRKRTRTINNTKRKTNLKEKTQTGQAKEGTCTQRKRKGVERRRG